jgi:hypothetical protein
MSVRVVSLDVLREVIINVKLKLDGPCMSVRVVSLDVLREVIINVKLKLDVPCMSVRVVYTARLMYSPTSYRT